MGLFGRTQATSSAWHPARRATTRHRYTGQSMGVHQHAAGYHPGHPKASPKRPADSQQHGRPYKPPQSQGGSPHPAKQHAHPNTSAIRRL